MCSAGLLLALRGVFLGSVCGYSSSVVAGSAGLSYPLNQARSDAVIK